MSQSAIATLHLPVSTLFLYNKAEMILQNRRFFHVMQSHSFAEESTISGSQIIISSPTMHSFYTSAIYSCTERRIGSAAAAAFSFSGFTVIFRRG